MAHNYPKILAPFARDTASDKYVNLEKWSKPEFKVLNDIDWEWTAKADGTSIGLRWDGERVSFIGHTDKSQIPPKLLKYLQDTFGTSEAESVFEDLYGSVPVTVYGEGISSETNENYGHPDGWFIAFDVKCDLPNGRWWDRKSVKTFVSKFPGIIEVPLLFTGSIEKAVDFIKQYKFYNNPNNKDKNYLDHIIGQKTFYQLNIDLKCPYDCNRPLEGVVGRPPVELLNSNGERIICKVKCKDYY